MRIRLVTAGLVALAVLASTLSVDVADPEPASAHVKRDCEAVQTSDWVIVNYRYEWVQSFTDDGYDTSGPVLVPVWGFRTYWNCGPPIPHSHWLRNLIFCTVVAAGSAAATGGATVVVQVAAAGAGTFVCGVATEFIPEGI